MMASMKKHYNFGMVTRLTRRFAGLGLLVIGLSAGAAAAAVVLSIACGQVAFAQDAQEPAKPEAKVQPAQPFPFPDDPVALAAEGNKFKAQGAYDQATVYYQRALKLDSRQFDARLGLGMVLDLQGNYTEAQQELEKALASAPDNGREQRDAALTALAVSHAFAGDLATTERYYEKLYDYQVSTQRLDKAATTAHTIGRAYLDTGDTRQAAQWYQTGQDTVKKMSGLPGDQIDLWQMRWEQAQSRLAARNGNLEDADVHLAAMKSLIDKGGLNAAQTASYQYLVGYNAFQAGQFDAAIEALAKADPRDPTTLTLLAEAYAKKGDAASAKQVMSKVAILPLHTLQGALARRDVKKLDEQLAKEAKDKEAKEKQAKEKREP
jgi:tetratricopeptide (TPR) repeat protein